MLRRAASPAHEDSTRNASLSPSPLTKPLRPSRPSPSAASSRLHARLWRRSPRRPPAQSAPRPSRPRARHSCRVAEAPAPGRCCRCSWRPAAAGGSQRARCPCRAASGRPRPRPCRRSMRALQLRPPRCQPWARPAGQRRGGLGRPRRSASPLQGYCSWASCRPAPGSRCGPPPCAALGGSCSSPRRGSGPGCRCACPSSCAPGSRCGSAAAESRRGDCRAHGGGSCCHRCPGGRESRFGEPLRLSRKAAHAARQGRDNGEKTKIARTGP
mmetsp:Transcript_88631/g.268735  ORF Transcript_88631/g.268735 Transcript_88631/m.268735 type:complete len:270 (-) Transcript_88631:1-810(-)